jgi:hypothetical protein
LEVELSEKSIYGYYPVNARKKPSLPQICPGKGEQKG